MSVSPRKLFSIFAAAEMVTWAGLIAAMVCRASGIADFVSIAGGVHGFVFLSYVTVTIFVWVNQKWKAPVGVAGVLLSAIPFATVPFEMFLDKRGLLEGGWRLAPDGELPRSPLEKLQALVLRRPVIAIALLFALIVVVFVVLLVAGPPVPKN